jgi:hypothetical protein
MNRDRFAGRVGGLAVALGVGTAVFAGQGPALAETAEPAGPDATSETGPAASAPAARAGTERTRPGPAAPGAADDDAVAGLPAATDGAADRPAARTAPQRDDRDSTGDPAAVGIVAPLPAAGAPVSATAQAEEFATALSQPEGLPANPPEGQAVAVAPTASVAAAEMAAPPQIGVPVQAAPAEVTTVLPGTLGTLLGGFADDVPAPPGESPLSWAMLAAARRESPVAPAAAAQAVPSVPQSVCSESTTACALIVGPSGVPVPSQAYVDNVMALYVQPSSPATDYTVQVIDSPEGANPITGVKSLPLTISVVQGQEIVENTVNALTLPTGPVAPGTPFTYFGFSQSAIIASLLQQDMLDDPALLPGLDRDNLSFVTVGNEMNPNGGWFSRFPTVGGFDLAFPSTGLEFYGPSPQEAFPTTNYTLEYDGFADFPRYPLNVLSVLNAAMGIALVHTNYTNPIYFENTYGDDPIATDGPGTACNEGTSAFCSQLPSTAENQRYFFMKTPNLPLLVPLRAIPLIGNPLADLIQPVLKVIVDLGYGDPAHGFSSGVQPPANTSVTIGLFPQVNPLEVLERLVNGVVEGVTDFVASFGPGGSVQREIAAIGSTLATLAALPTSGPAGLAGAPGAGGIIDSVIGTVQKVINDVAFFISAGASALYTTLLATADFLNAGTISLLGYGANLALNGVAQALGGDPIGGLVNAIGLPIAAVAGQITTVSVFQILVWLEALLAVATGCGPGAPTTPGWIQVALGTVPPALLGLCSA